MVLLGLEKTHSLLVESQLDVQLAELVLELGEIRLVGPNLLELVLLVRNLGVEDGQVLTNGGPQLRFLRLELYPDGRSSPGSP